MAGCASEPRWPLTVNSQLVTRVGGAGHGVKGHFPTPAFVQVEARRGWLPSGHRRFPDPVLLTPCTHARVSLGDRAGTGSSHEGRGGAALLRGPAASIRAVGQSRLRRTPSCSPLAEGPRP